MKGIDSVAETKTYIYKNQLVDMGKFGNFTPDEQQLISDHFEYLKQALKHGQLILAGPCLDAAFGLVIYRADSMEEAQRFMEADPAIQQGLMIADLHEYRISLLEGRD
jgi:uncharacterized protein